MLQIFVRPHGPDLEPGIQFGELPPAPRNAWRDVFGPEGGPAPFHVRNAVACRDLRLEAGARAALPTRPGRHCFFYVFAGRVAAGGLEFGAGACGLCEGDDAIELQALEGALQEAPGEAHEGAPGDAIVVAFTLDAQAPVHRGGTVGDGETVHRMAREHRAAP